MRPGTKPKPTATKKLEGDIHKERWNKNEPKTEPSMPTCPSHIEGAAKTEWKRVTKELFDKGILDRIDRAGLAAYCDAYGRWVKATKELKEFEEIFPGNGLTVRTSNGNWIVNPLINVINKSLEQMHKFAVEFGMTPSSRTRINIGKEPSEDDEFDEFLKDNREH